MDARVRCQGAAAFGQRGSPQVLQFVQRRELGLEILLQRALGVRGAIALGNIEPERRDRGNHHHHRRRKSSPKSRDSVSTAFACFDHGKSTRIVSPLFSSTGFSSVVLLSVHALSV